MKRAVPVEAQTLDLYSKGLGDAPRSVWSRTELKRLNLAGNQLTSLST
jgi:Leucine-rich repeat (LRR) protein